MLPVTELHRFTRVIESLKIRDEAKTTGALLVGFSYSYVGNAPPVLAGTVLRRKEIGAPIPYLISIFVAGSVCFQVWVRSDDMDKNVRGLQKLRIRWTNQLPRPEGGYQPIQYSDPIQFDWSGLLPQLQPFEAFELEFNPKTTEGVLTPIAREL